MLRIVDSSTLDNSVVRLHPDQMDRLCLFRGDTVRLSSSGSSNAEGPKRKTVCIALPEEGLSAEEVETIRMNQTVRNNLGLQPGEQCMVEPAPDLPYAQAVRLLRIADDATAIADGAETTTDWISLYLKPYFMESYRPVSIGDRFSTPSASDQGSAASFVVSELRPARESCIIGPDCQIECSNEPQTGREESVRLML